MNLIESAHPAVMKARHRYLHTLAITSPWLWGTAAASKLVTTRCEHGALSVHAAAIEAPHNSRQRLAPRIDEGQLGGAAADQRAVALADRVADWNRGGGSPRIGN
jgi:hypothetical protein